MDLGSHSLVAPAPGPARGRRLVRRASAFCAAALAVLVAAPASAAQAPDLSGSAFVLVTEPGTGFGQPGQVRVLTPETRTFGSVLEGPLFNSWLYPIGGSSVDGWWVRMGAPSGQPLAPGAYEEATQGPPPGKPYLEVGGEARGCGSSQSGGRFVVAHAEIVDGGVRFEGSFSQRCATSTGAIHGQIRIGPAGADVLGPALAVPSGAEAPSLVAETLAGRNVTFPVAAADVGDPQPALVCSPASGSLFPVGRTEVTCVASDTAGNATTRSFPVRVRLARPLALAAPDGSVRAGKRIHVTATLVPHMVTGNRVVSLFRIRHGKPKTLLARGPVDELGRLTATDAPSAKTTYVAEWAGDGVHPAVARQRVVTVEPRVRATVRGHVGRAGRFHVFPLARPAEAIGSVAPAHPGRRLLFIAQRKVGGTWKKFASARFRIRANGTARAFLFVSTAGDYRIRTRFEGDADHVAAASGWTYVRFTR